VQHAPAQHGPSMQAPTQRAPVQQHAPVQSNQSNRGPGQPHISAPNAPHINAPSGPATNANGVQSGVRSNSVAPTAPRNPITNNNGSLNNSLRNNAINSPRSNTPNSMNRNPVGANVNSNTRSSANTAANNGNHDGHYNHSWYRGSWQSGAQRPNGSQNSQFANRNGQNRNFNNNNNYNNYGSGAGRYGVGYGGNGGYGGYGGYGGGYGGYGYGPGGGVGSLLGIGLALAGYGGGYGGLGYGGMGYGGLGYGGGYGGYGGYGLMGGMPIGWGLGGWGLGRMAYSSGYYSYNNPYYASSGGGYNYSQPIAVAYADAPSDTTQFDDAVAQFKAGDYESALTTIDSAIQQNSGDPAMHEFRALTLYALGNYTAAAATIHSVLAVGPGWNWPTMSGLYTDVGVYESQLRALEQASEARMSEADLHFLLAYHYTVMKHEKEAIYELQEVVKLQPNDRLASDLLKMHQVPQTADAQPAPAATTTAAPAAPEPQPVAVEAIQGTWHAQREDGSKFEIQLQPDKNFTWSVDQQGHKETMNGKYDVQKDLLALESDKAGGMVGHVALDGDDKFTFKLLGAPKDDSGLTFSKD
jgi:tetratricopeptide (TPR) repeat protein